MPMLSRARISILVCLLAAVCQAADVPWQVEDAPIRFTLGITSRPTHPSAGYFAELPDGGILPRPALRTHVMDERGRELKSYVLWHNPAASVAIVFEAPERARTLYVYVSPASELNTWDPDTGLTPSAILCTNPDDGSMDTARRLGQLGTVGPRVHFVNKAGVPQAPLCIQGDLTGRPQPSAFYMLAYLVVSDPGETWIAPFANVGATEVRVDGTRIGSRKKIDKWGGTGDSVNLSKGLHRFEIFSACNEPGESFGNRGVMFMTWRPPRTTIEELGGKRPSDAPQAGTSKWAARRIKQNEIVRSGGCRVEGVRAQDGGPVAYFHLRPTECFWFGDDDPFVVYDLRAVTDGNPPDTQYEWTISNVARLGGKEATAFFRGMAEHRVALTAVSGDRRSACRIPFYAYTTIRTDLSKEATRERFREACLDMMKAYPPDVDPTAEWNDTLWKCFFESMDLGKGEALLAELFLKRWKFVKDKIPPEKQMFLEDLFFQWIAWYDPDKALQWLELREQEWTSGERRKQLRVMMAEVAMYQKQDTKTAKNILLSLSRGMDEASRLVDIRLGDVAFLEGNLNEANKYWGSVQRETRRPVARTADSTEPWKKTAIQNTEYATSVKSLITQGFMMQALQTLREWEMSSPESKLSSDYFVQEARLFSEIGNMTRARVLLEAYCRNVDASSDLADAAKLLLDIMMDQGEPDDVLRHFCEDMKKRFAYHPLAHRMDVLLRLIESGGSDRAPTIDVGPSPVE